MRLSVPIRTSGSTDRTAMLPVSRRVLRVCVWFLACGTIGLTICLPKSDLPDEQVVLMGWILATIGFPCTLLGCTVLAGAVYGMMAFGMSFPASYPWSAAMSFGPSFLPAVPCSGS